MAIISGILRDPIGQPIPDCIIELIAIKTTLTVIARTNSNLLSDRLGSYSMNVEPGDYKVYLYFDGCPKNQVGIIHVYSDSSPGSLNDFLIEPGETSLTPELVQIFQQLRNDAKEAAEKSEINRLATEQAKVQSVTVQNDVTQKYTVISELADDIDKTKTQLIQSAQTAQSNADQTAGNLAEIIALKERAEQSEIIANQSKQQAEQYAQSAQAAESEAKKYADNATKVVSEANIAGIVNRQIRQVLYIDNINGNDSNDGLTTSKPLKTFTKASALIPSGATATLYVMSDYTFSDEETAVTFQGASIFIRSQFISKPVTIKFSYNSVPAYPEQYFMNSFIFYYSGTIEFCNINLKLPDIPSDHAVGKYYPHGASVVRTNSSNLVAVQLGVRLNSVNIVVPEPTRSEWHLVGNPRGMTDLILVGVTMPSEWRDRNKVFFEGRLSDTVFCKRTLNITTALNKDNTVYNDGRVK